MLGTWCCGSRGGQGGKFGRFCHELPIVPASSFSKVGVREQGTLGKLTNVLILEPFIIKYFRKKA